MKLEVGMYVRIKGYFGHTHIFKIVKIKGDEIYSFYKDETNLSYCLKEDVLKASHNIIDLIEVGDYVNGYLVTTGNQGVGSIYISEIDGLGLKKKLYEKDIKSIVTKEQFENMSYKLGDE